MHNTAKITLVCFIIFLSSERAKSQNARNISQDFRAASSVISRQTNNTYRLVRMGSNKTPAILASGTAAKKIPQAMRNDEEAVRNFASAQALILSSKALLLPENISLTHTGTRRTGNLWLSSFTASYNGIPLRERFLHINIGAISGEVMLARNSIPAKKPNSLSASIEKNLIVPQTINLLGSHSEITSPPKLVFVDEGENPSLRLCYEIIASEPDMYEMWRLTFDALTGELIEKKSLVEHECFNTDTGTDCSPFEEKADGLQSIPLKPSDIPSGMVLAKVHLHSPYDTLTTVGLPYAMLSVNGVNIVTDSTGWWSLPSAQYPVTVQTSFNSPFFSILRQDNIPNSTLIKVFPNGEATVLWDSDNSNDAERDGYYSASIAHLADKRIDEKLTGIDSHMKVNVNFPASCNAFYIPKDTSINFFSTGTECSNTAEISDVVFHEYGHRVTNARYTLAAGHNNNIVNGSLSEGFADLNSAFIRDDPRIGIGFFGDPKTTSKVIRSCDNTKKWPADISHDIHISGEIISGAFWDLRKLIGRDTAEHLFHFMEYQLPDGAEKTDSASLEDAFAATFAALILTDDEDNNLSNGTPHLKEILEAFKLHNVTLGSFLDLEVGILKDQDTALYQYTVPLTVCYAGIIGGIDSMSLKLFYSLDGGANFVSVPFQKNGNNFQGIIPKAPAGSHIQYYASGATTDRDTIVSPPGYTYAFYVGVKQSVNSSPRIGLTLPYPNPIRRGEKLHLSGAANITLTDMLGRTIISSTTDEVLVPNSIPSGLYFIEKMGERYKIVVF